MSNSDKPVGLMVRLPANLHEDVKAFAAGTAKRPPTSMNQAIAFLLRAGLSAVELWENTEALDLAERDESTLLDAA